MSGFAAPAASRPLALVLMLCASALIAATTLLAKALGTAALGPPLDPLQVAHGRFVFALMGVLLAVALLRPSFGPVHWKLHTARTTCGVIGVTLMFAAAARIPLADATAISFLNPVFTMILAIPLLGERVGRVRWTAAAVAFAGVLILLRPGTGAFEAAALLALGAAMAIGLEVIFIKRLAGRERPLQVLLINNTLGAAIASCAVIWVWSAPTPAQWAALAALGLCMAGAQAFFINAMARAEASFIVPFSYATLIFATLYDAAIFASWPDAISAVGAAVILAGALLLAWREAQLNAVRA